MGRVKYEEQQKRKGRHRVQIRYFSATRLVFEALWKSKGDKLQLNIPDTLVFLPGPEGSLVHVRWLFTSKEGKILRKSVTAPPDGTKLLEMDEFRESMNDIQIETDRSGNSTNGSFDESDQESFRPGIIDTNTMKSDKEKLDEMNHVIRYQQLLLKAFSQFTRVALSNPENKGEVAAKVYYANGASKLLTVNQLDTVLKTSQSILIRDHSSQTVSSPKAVFQVGSTGQGTSAELPSPPEEGDIIVAIQQYLVPKPKQFGVSTMTVYEHEYKLDSNGITFSSTSHRLEPVSSNAVESCDNFMHLKRVLVRASVINHDLNTLAARLVKRINCFVGHRAVGILVGRYFQTQTGELVFTYAPWISFILSPTERHERNLGSGYGSVEPFHLPEELMALNNDTLTRPSNGAQVDEETQSHCNTSQVPKLEFEGMSYKDSDTSYSNTDRNHCDKISQQYNSGRRHSAPPSTLPSTMTTSSRSRKRDGQTKRSYGGLTRRSSSSSITSSMSKLLRGSKSVSGGLGSAATISLPRLQRSTMCYGDFCDFEHDTSHSLDTVDGREGDSTEHDARLGDFAGEDGMAFGATAIATKEIHRKLDNSKQGNNVQKAKPVMVFNADRVRVEEHERLQRRIQRFRVENPNFEELPEFSISESTERGTETSDHARELIILDGAEDDMIVHHSTYQENGISKLKHGIPGSTSGVSLAASTVTRGSRKQLASSAFFSKASRVVNTLPSIHEASSRSDATGPAKGGSSSSSITRVTSKGTLLKLAYKSILTAREPGSLLLMSNNMSEWIKRHNALRDWFDGPGSLRILAPFHRTAAVEREKLEILWDWVGDINSVKIQLIHGGICEFDEADIESDKKNARTFGGASSNASRKQNIPTETSATQTSFEEEEKLVCTLCVAVENDGRHVVELPSDLDKLVGMKDKKQTLERVPNWRIRLSDTNNIGVYAYSRKFFVVQSQSSRTKLIAKGFAQEMNLVTQLVTGTKTAKTSLQNPAMYYDSVTVCQKCYKIYKNLDTKRRMVVSAMKKHERHTQQTKTTSVDLKLDVDHPVSTSTDSCSSNDENRNEVQIGSNAGRNTKERRRERINELAKPKYRTEKVIARDELFEDLFGDQRKGKRNGTKQQRKELNQTEGIPQAQQSIEVEAKNQFTGLWSQEFATKIMKQDNTTETVDDNTFEKLAAKQKKQQEDELLLETLLGDGSPSSPTRRRKGKKKKKASKERKVVTTGKSPGNLNTSERDDTRLKRLNDTNPALGEMFTLLAMGRLKDVRKLLRKIEERGVTSLAFVRMDPTTGKLLLEYDWSSSQYHLRVREFNISKTGKWIYDMLDKHAAISQVILWMFEAWLDPLQSGALIPKGEVDIFAAVGRKVVWKELNDSISGLKIYSKMNEAARGRLELMVGVQLLLQGKRDLALNQIKTALATSIRLFGLWSYEVGMIHFIIGKYTVALNPIEAQSHLDAAQNIFSSETQGDTMSELKFVEALRAQCDELLGTNTNNHSHSIQPRQEVDHSVVQSGDANISDNKEESINVVPLGVTWERPSTAVVETIDWGTRSINAFKRRIHHERLLPGDLDENMQSVLSPMMLAKIEAGSHKLSTTLIKAQDLVNEMKQSTGEVEWPPKIKSERPMTVNTMERTVAEALDEVAFQTRSLIELKQNALDQSDRNVVSTTKQQVIDGYESPNSNHLHSPGSDHGGGFTISSQYGPPSNSVQQSNMGAQPNESMHQNQTSDVTNTTTTEGEHFTQPSNKLENSSIQFTDSSDSEEESDCSESDDNESANGTENNNTLSNENETITQSEVNVDLVFDACSKRQLDRLEQFGKLTKLSELVNFESNTLLHVTASIGWVEGVHFCLAQGIPINKQNIEGNTALHLASAQRELTVELLLVALGSDVTLVNVYGLTYNQGTRPT